MTAIDKLASSLGRRDQLPNKELAKAIVENADEKSIEELVANLNHKNKNIAGDCIKVLYEIGELQPSLIVAYAHQFEQLLDNKNNNLQWDAMTALDSITDANPAFIYNALPKLTNAADKGSVI